MANSIHRSFNTSLTASFNGSHRSESLWANSIWLNPDIDKQVLPQWLRSWLGGDKDYRIIYSKAKHRAKESEHHLKIPLTNSPQSKEIKFGYSLYKK